MVHAIISGLEKFKISFGNPELRDWLTAHTYKPNDLLGILSIVVVIEKQ